MLANCFKLKSEFAETEQLNKSWSSLLWHEIEKEVLFFARLNSNQNSIQEEYHDDDSLQNGNNASESNEQAVQAPIDQDYKEIPQVRIITGNLLFLKKSYGYVNQYYAV
ncbi:hypothetical protein BDC45DRAFT_531990 [Circinella umbellata]|nr:hypothetical protein BDC45DRAFT_531990 [Circinella umbellata]